MMRCYLTLLAIGLFIPLSVFAKTPTLVSPGKASDVAPLPGAPLRNLPGPVGMGEQFGACFAFGVADRNYDGLKEFLVIGAMHAQASISGHSEGEPFVDSFAIRDGGLGFTLSNLSSVSVNGDGTRGFISQPSNSLYINGRGYNNVGRVTFYDLTRPLIRPIAQIDGNASYANLGTAMLGSIDFNRDGVYDYVIGCPACTHTIYGVDYIGSIALLDGREIERFASTGYVDREYAVIPAAWNNYLLRSSYRYGESLLRLDDLLHNGSTNFAVGAPYYAFNFVFDDGYVFIHHLNGPRAFQSGGFPSVLPTTRIYGDASGFGHAMATFGNGRYLAVAAPGRNADIFGHAISYGSVHIYDLEDIFRHPGVDDPQSILTINGLDVNGQFGWSMSSGDFDGDHITDLVVSEPFYQQEGMVYIYRGTDFSLMYVQRSPERHLPNDPPLQFGMHVEVTDVNRDGRPEVAVSNQRKNNGDGEVYFVQP